MRVRKVEDNRKGILIILGILGVIIAGLVIAIVVVLNTRSGNEVVSEEETEEEQVLAEDEAVNIYDNITNELNTRIVEENITDGLAIIDMYKKKIDTVEDERARAMLMADYWMLRISQDPGMDIKDEVINGLIEVDDILKTPASGMGVVSAASYYGDDEVKDRYEAIVNERFEEESKGVAE